MRKIVLASHGLLANGMKHTVEMILGVQDQLFTLCAYMEENDHTKELIKNIITEKKEDEELIVVTDIFGGSINNEFMNYLHDYSFYLVSGMNLPLIVELISASNDDNIGQIIQSYEENRNHFVKYCNALIKTAQSADEDF